MVPARNCLGMSTWKQGLVMSSNSTIPVVLCEDDISGASLAGRQPASLKNYELRHWMKCRGDSCKGLTTKAPPLKLVAR